MKKEKKKTIRESEREERECLKEGTIKKKFHTL